VPSVTDEPATDKPVTDEPSTEPPWYAALPEGGPGPSVRWTSDAFEAELRAWVVDALDDMGTGLVAIQAVHQRPWSTLWRATAADRSRYWIKQNCPHQAFEAALLVVLDAIAPDRVVPVAAADTERGLHLVPDQGPVFAETVAGDDLDGWCRVAAEAMHLQRELIGHEADLVGVGVSVMRPAEATAYVRARVASLEALPDGDPRRMTQEVADRLRRLLPDVAGWAADLDALGLGENLVHNDLHANNVFATPGGMRFFDFGDSVLAHPLSALFIPLNVLLHRLETAPDDARLRRVADAGLEVWGDVVPGTQLRAALPAALHLGRLLRAESWLRVTATLTPPELAEYGDAGTWWLGALGDEPPLS
jgi:hypothetical protein